MILADTSVWIDHFRSGSPRLAALLRDGGVVSHPFVIGELACGNLSRRGQILGYLDRLPTATPATDDEVRALIELRSLHGEGLGWVDAHLIASALMGGDTIWTLDGPLARSCERLGISA